MMSPLELASTNLGIGIPDLLILFTSLVLLLFYAVDFRIGVVLTFFLFSVDVIVFQALGFPTSKIVILALASFVLLALSMYLSVAKNRQAVY